MSNFDEIYASLSDDERDELSVIEDPIRWAEVSLKNPRKPSDPFVWRNYQKKMVAYQPEWKIDEHGKKKFVNRFKVYRCGRRSGKTASMAAELLWHAFTKPDFKIIIVTPFESQVREIFRMMGSMIKESFIIPTRFVKKPYLMEFGNGSTITGYTAGAGSSTKGTGIRGTEADLIILDECDHGIDDVINEVIFPIYNLNPTCILIMSSTPSGRHGLFWNICTRAKEWKAEEFHIPSTMIPGWDKDEEEACRRSARTASNYQHEYLAEFGSLEEGVFLNKHIMECLREYKYETLGYDETKQYFMGVDWNEVHGVTINILEKRKNNPMAKIWKKIRIERSEFTQPEAVEEIIDWTEKIKFKAIFIDKGFGAAQDQWLRKYGLEHPGSKLNEIVTAIDFGGKIIYRDTVNNKKIKKDAKPFLVDNAVFFVENHILEMPKFEDEANSLVGAMRGYKVKRFSAKSNQPVYECEVPDHELDALFLALLAITITTTNISKTTPHKRPKRTAKPFVADYEGRADYYEDAQHDVNSRKVSRAVQTALPGYKREKVQSKKSKAKIKARKLSMNRRPHRTNI